MRNETEQLRALLARCIKYAREDRMVTPGVTRLARALAEAETLLSTTNESAPAPAEKPECTGVTAFWCPRCGDCSCPRDVDGGCDFDTDGCPLHGSPSQHAAAAQAVDEPAPESEPNELDVDDEGCCTVCEHDRTFCTCVRCEFCSRVENEENWRVCGACMEVFQRYWDAEHSHPAPAVDEATVERIAERLRNVFAFPTNFAARLVAGDDVAGALPILVAAVRSLEILAAIQRVAAEVRRGT